MNTVLVCYYTKNGSTREAAEIIFASLQKQGMEADVLPIADITTLDTYETVIIGAPIHGMQWVPEATEFVEENREELRKKKTAVFCLSYIYFTGGNFWKKAIEKALERAAIKIGSVKQGIFGGRIDSSLPSPMLFIFGIPKNPPLSVFEKAPIEKWVRELIGTL